MKNKTLAWWDSSNFGDALNPYIFRAFGVNVSYAQSNMADVIALGSLMERLFKGAHTKDETFFSSVPIDVWGSGVHFESGKHIEQPGIELPEKLIREVNFLAVRGKITKERIEAILGRSLGDDLPLGDPGLLMNKIIKGSSKKKYDLGVVPHFHDQSSELITGITKNIPNSIVLNVKSDPVKFIKKLTQCKAIISSAMHPIIVADSYGIPNIWATTGNEKISLYKYKDYYSSLGISSPPIFKLHESIFGLSQLEKLKNEYSVNRKKVESLQLDLIDSFPYLNRRKKLNFLNFYDVACLRWREVGRDYKNYKFLEKIKGYINKYIYG